MKKSKEEKEAIISVEEILEKKNNKLSERGLLLAIFSLFINVYGLIGIISIIISYKGFKKTADDKNRRYSMIGMIIGAISTLFGIFMILKVYEII